MALHWAWAFGISGDDQTYWDADWQWSLTTYADPNYSAAPLPRHPLNGYGGMDKGMVLYTNRTMTTAPWPLGALADGQIQFHIYGGMTNTTSRIRLKSSTGVILLEIRPTTVTSSPTLSVYSGEGTMTLRGTTTAVLPNNTWNTIAIRFKVGASGDIAISINGDSQVIVAAGTTGATSSWARLSMTATLSNIYVTGITVWDDGPNDDALSVTRWVPFLRPYQDDTNGSWTASSGSDLYAMVDDDPVSTTDYCVTTTDPDEVRMDVRTSDINASWSPLSIDGVSVVSAMRGDGALNTGQPVIDDGLNNLLGTSQTTDSETSVGINDTFATQADGSTAWNKTAVDGHTYGVKAS